MAVVEPVPFTQNQRDEVRTLGDKTGALNAAAGTKQQTYILQGAMIGRSEKNGPQGSGVNKDVSFTLDATDRHEADAGKAYRPRRSPGAPLDDGQHLHPHRSCRKH